MCAWIAGQHEGVQGAATTFTEMNVWDVVIDAGKEAVLTVPDNHSLSMVVLRGQAQFNGQEQAGAGQLEVRRRRRSESGSRRRRSENLVVVLRADC